MVVFQWLTGSFLALNRRASGILGGLLRWRAFPWAFQWPMVGVVALVVVLALRGPRHSELNPGAAIVWQLWWAILPFFIVLTARLWCAVCPFPVLGDAAQRLRTSPPPLPPPALRRVAPWVGAVGLGILGFLFLLLQVETSGPLTAALLLALAAAAVGTALLWQRRAWCRYLCPLGLMVGLYSRLGWLRLDAGKESAKAAYTAKRCPLFTSAVAQRRASDCVLCGACLYGRGGQAVEACLGRPSLAGQSLTPAEAVAVSLLLGLLLSDALRMTPILPGYMAWAMETTGRSYEEAMAVGIGGVMAVVLLVQAAGARALGCGQGFWPAFSLLGLAWLPLALAAHIGLSAQHLLAAGAVFRDLGAEVWLLAPGHMPQANAYVTVWPMRAFQWSIVVLGGVVAAYLARRLAAGGKGYEWAPAAVLPALPLVVVFGQPMSTAC